MIQSAAAKFSENQRQPFKDTPLKVSGLISDDAGLDQTLERTPIGTSEICYRLRVFQLDFSIPEPLRDRLHFITREAGGNNRPQQSLTHWRSFLVHDYKLEDMFTGRRVKKQRDRKIASVTCDDSSFCLFGRYTSIYRYTDFFTPRRRISSHLRRGNRASKPMLTIN